MITIIL
jgi:protein SPT2